MRKNLPVTNHEYLLEDGRPIVSMTDLKGKITYTNPYFVEVSGFSEEELIGAPHNIVRHPDMPSDAFADLWSTLQQGGMWSALVKNRRKNGDFYWVKASVAPIVEQGRTVGYMSVRTKPGRNEIQAAEDLYRRMREGQAQGIMLRQGQVLHRGWRGMLSRVRGMTLGRRIAVVSLIQLAALAVAVTSMAAGNDGSPVLHGFGIGAALLAIVTTLIQWTTFHGGVVRPLRQANDAVRALAGGDLTHDVELGRMDEVGRMLRGLHQVNVTLQALIGDVRANAAVVSSASKDIAAGNMDLASRTEAQAASLEESASSMEEFSSTVRQNADNAQQANQLVESATGVALQGGDMVEKVGATMSEIVESSQRIGEIVSIIDGIAFQTNILALNAAVEAARAGEHGRGFAVVASEVRSLAQRSSTAAREIGSLIRSSVERVEAGGELVSQAQQTMQDIVASVKRVASIVAEITVASNEQAVGVQQVNQAISHMDQVTQQNAALVEQAASASASLHEQAAQLNDAMSVFRVRNRR